MAETEKTQAAKVEAKKAQQSEKAERAKNHMKIISLAPEVL